MALDLDLDTFGSSVLMCVNFKYWELLDEVLIVKHPKIKRLLSSVVWMLWIFI